jgi:hypothetical protein
MPKAATKGRGAGKVEKKKGKKGRSPFLDREYSDSIESQAAWSHKVLVASCHETCLPVCPPHALRFPHHEPDCTSKTASRSTHWSSVYTNYQCQTPMPPSAVCPPICSSPTSSVRTSVRRTQVSPSVRTPVPSLRHRHNPNTSVTGQVGKILGERWKALNDKQRTPYEAKAATDKKRYEDEKQAYNVWPISQP